jgi:ABC-type polysaccharide/polyol phosphate export permease
MIKSAIRRLFDLQINSPVLWQLVKQQLILRYRRTALGYLWTLINPLLMMSIMALVFSTLFKEDIKTFAIFLFAGMIPWSFFNSVVAQSGSAFISNESLIKKIYLPKIIFPLSIAYALLIDSMLSFIALFFIILMIGGTLTWAMIFIPIAYLLLFFFALGVGLIMSVATVFFRDLQHVILIGMQGLFFLTPIIYKHNSLSGNIAWLINLNPVVPFIELFRAPLYDGNMPTTDVVIASVLISLAAMIVGLTVFLRQEKKLVFRL